MSSGATLATVVGVLVEVPLMLSLVKIMKVNREKFEEIKMEKKLVEAEEVE